MKLLKAIIKLVLWIRSLLQKRLLRLRGRLQMGSLREAITKADGIKDNTGRKAIVVFDNGAGAFDALQKKQLKRAAEKRKIKGQPPQTKYRKDRPVKKSQTRFTNDRIRHLEKKSAYVTK